MAPPPAVPEPGAADPFGTAALRAATLTGWAASPTRLAEDAAAEADLVQIGYRDRLLTELAANAADAATEADVAGRLRIDVDGDCFTVANTGAPLSVAGVRALTALRVSPKNAGSGDAGPSEVGRFGVGFRATAFADRVQISSRDGGIEFDRQRTAETLAEAGIPAAGPVPAQRLAWPLADPPPAGFDTEVRVHTADPAHAARLLAAARAEAPDLLLELSALTEIDVAGTVFTRRADGPRIVVDRDGAPLQTWLAAHRGGTTWLVRLVDGPGGLRLAPDDGDVLRSPTPTGIELTLPARLITDLPLTPDRRGLHPDADLAAAAVGYPELVALAPGDQKHLLVPSPVLAAGEVDAALHHAVIAALRSASWVPTAVGGGDGAVGEPTGETAAPSRVRVLRGLTVELGALLAPVVGALAAPELSGAGPASALLRLGAAELSLAELADLLSGREDEPSWWADLYEQLGVLIPDAQALAELGALPVPRADGRLQRGARGLVLVDDLTSPALAAADWIPAVHPQAYHPLLERLGAEHLSLAEVLSHPGLHQRIEDSESDHRELADTVLRLLADAADGSPAEGSPAEGSPTEGSPTDGSPADSAGLPHLPAWLGGLELPGADGESRPADELLLPGSPLQAVLVDDSPFGTVAESVVAEYGSAPLRALGVGWGFSVVVDELPTGPDHDLPDEEQWWAQCELPPERLVAVRDLDLVDPDRWPAALELLAGQPELAPLLAGPDGYTHWWLRRYAEIDGRPLRGWRSLDRPDWTGLFEPLAEPWAAGLGALLAGDLPDDADDAVDWLAALADPGLSIAPGVAARAHAALVAAQRAGRFRVDEVALPDGLRTLAGTVAAEPLIVDQRWWLPVLDAAAAVVVAGDESAARAFAELVDADPVSRAGHAVVVSEGRALDGDSAAAVRAGLLLGLSAGGPRQWHERLEVLVELPGDADRHRHAVSWWQDPDGTVYLSDGPAG